MPDAKISELAADASLTGTEQVPVNDGGATKRVTTQQIADLGSGLPDEWTDNGDGSVTAATSLVTKTPLTIEQNDDPVFDPGVPALIVKAAENVTAKPVEVRDVNGNVKVSIRANDPPSIILRNADGSKILTLAADSGAVVTDSITISAQGGIGSTPTVDGFDALFLEATNLTSANGSAMIRMIHPVDDTPDGFYTDDSLTINADMTDGAAFLLIKGKTTTGTVVKHAVPLKAGGWTVQTYTASNVSTDRSYNANATTIDELADVLGTLIADLRAQGIVA